MARGVRRRIINRLGRIQVVRVKHLAQWMKDKEYDKKKRVYRVTAAPSLAAYFYATGTDYVEGEGKTNIKLSFRFVGKPGNKAGFKDLVEKHIGNYYSSALTKEARIEIADLEENDQLGEFQYLYNEKPRHDRLSKELQKELEGELL